MLWNKYLIDRPGFSLGYDLTSWALPLNIAVGSRNLHVQILCVDIDLYWGLD